MLLSKFLNFYLNTRKNNVVIKKSTYKHLSLNVKVLTTYTTNLNFVPCMTQKKKKINVQYFKKQHFFYGKLYILLLFTKV